MYRCWNEPPLSSPNGPGLLPLAPFLYWRLASPSRLSVGSPFLWAHALQRDRGSRPNKGLRPRRSRPFPCPGARCQEIFCPSRRLWITFVPICIFGVYDVCASLCMFMQVVVIMAFVARVIAYTRASLLLACWRTCDAAWMSMLFIASIYDAYFYSMLTPGKMFI